MAIDIYNDGPDFLTISGYHYETLSIQSGLINPETNSVTGVIDFNTWKAAVLTDLLSDGMIETASAIENDLPDLYLKAKTITIGCYIYRLGGQEFDSWTHQINNYLTEEEQIQTKPYLKEAFKLSSAAYLGI
jgi:hypothetical protein